MVIAELSDRLISCVDQEQFRTVVIYLCNGLQRVIANHRAHFVDELCRNLIAAVNRLAQFSTNFCTSRLTRDLDVPSIIITACTAAQSDLGMSESKIRSVVVNR